MLRELLLRELAAIIHQEIGAQKVLVAEPGPAGGLKVVAAHGYSTDDEKDITVESLNRANEGQDTAQWAVSENAALLRLEAANASPALLIIVPRDATTFVAATNRDLAQFTW